MKILVLLTLILLKLSFYILVGWILKTYVDDLAMQLWVIVVLFRNIFDVENYLKKI